MPCSGRKLRSERGRDIIPEGCATLLAAGHDHRKEREGDCARETKREKWRNERERIERKREREGRGERERKRGKEREYDNGRGRDGRVKGRKDGKGRENRILGGG